MGSITTTSRCEIAWRKRCASDDPVPLKNSTQAEVSASSTLVPDGKPILAHGVQVAVPTDALHVQLLLDAHRPSAEQAFESQVDRLALGVEADGTHGPVDQVVVDVDVRPTHGTTLHLEVYRSGV
jgi:hypothetical protein